MNVMYVPIEEELTELLMRFFPDILSQEVLLEGYDLDSLGKRAFSGMYIERNGLLYLQRALRVNRYNNNDSKYWKEVTEEGGAPNHKDCCFYLNI
eukprot:7384752-Ditylum_brightwellii.AAC.1